MTANIDRELYYDLQSQLIAGAKWSATKMNLFFILLLSDWSETFARDETDIYNFLVTINYKKKYR